MSSEDTELSSEDTHGFGPAFEACMQSEWNRSKMAASGNRAKKKISFPEEWRDAIPTLLTQGTAPTGLY